jgi:hypothetical protein
MCIFPSTPKPLPPPVVPQKPDANEARVNELKRRANMKGFQATISPGTLLGAASLSPSNDASVTGGKTLLGA